MRKPSHLGKTLRNRGTSPIVHIENRPLNEDEKEVLAKRAEEQAARLARIAERAKKD